MYGVVVTEKSLLVEIPINSVSTGSIFTLPDNQILRQPNVEVYGVEVYNADQLTKSPGNRNTVTALGSTGLAVTLQDNKSINRINQAPYLSLNTAVNNGIIREFKPFKMVLTKSFITILDGTNLSVGQAAVLNIIYKEFSK
jgi:hypothetical protein